MFTSRSKTTSNIDRLTAYRSQKVKKTEPLSQSCACAWEHGGMGGEEERGRGGAPKPPPPPLGNKARVVVVANGILAEVDLFLPLLQSVRLGGEG